MTEIKLPTQKIKATHKSPKNLIIFSKPKVGKTELLAQLDNCLILDLEDGSDFVDALKVKASSVEDINEIGKKLAAMDHKYDYVAIDTMTALEQFCIPYGEVIYSRTPMGKNWFKKDAQTKKLSKASGKVMYGSIINLPNGAGYMYLREAFAKMIGYIKTWAPRIIQVCHVKDILLDKDGTEFNVMDLNLTGNIKRTTAAQSDAIGYIYRKGNQNIMTFKTVDDTTCGARPEHLRNAEIVISEMKEDGLVTHWDKVYID